MGLITFGKSRKSTWTYFVAESKLFVIKKKTIGSGFRSRRKSKDLGSNPGQPIKNVSYSDSDREAFSKPGSDLENLGVGSSDQNNKLDSADIDDAGKHKRLKLAKDLNALHRTSVQNGEGNSSDVTNISGQQGTPINA